MSPVSSLLQNSAGVMGTKSRVAQGTMGPGVGEMNSKCLGELRLVDFWSLEVLRPQELLGRGRSPSWVSSVRACNWFQEMVQR